MKEQRWPGDYQTKGEQFRSSKAQEQYGMNEARQDLGNDFLALVDREKMDRYDCMELEPSWATQLDTVGMQPHAREYLEREVNCMRSDRQYEDIGGQMIDYPKGIQFTGRP